MPPLKLVFDTNTYIMAAGMPGSYIDYWLDLATPPGNKFKLYTSSAVLAEVQKKLESRVGFERPLTVEYIERLKYVATVVTPRQKLDIVKNDHRR
jgi:hypothetical protein